MFKFIKNLIIFFFISFNSFNISILRFYIFFNFHIFFFVYGYNISFVKYNFLGKQNIINQEILKSKYAIYDGFQGLIKESYVYQNKNKDYIGIRNFTYFYISDFFLKTKDRKQYITLLINDELEKGKYNVTIVAFASYKIMSEDNITEEISLE